MKLQHEQTHVDRIGIFNTDVDVISVDLTECPQHQCAFTYDNTPW